LRVTFTVSVTTVLPSAVCLAHQNVFNRDDMFAASVAEFVSGHVHRGACGSDVLHITVAGLRWNQPHVAFAFAFQLSLSGDLECFDFAVSDLAV
jgi:hypothetical protein